METIVDQLKTVNSKSFLNEIKNPSNITILILKNNLKLGLDRVSSISLLLPPRRPSPTKGFLS